MTDETKIEKADVYSANERDWMIRTQQARARLFLPLLRLMAALKVTPDHITFLSLLSGLAFCPLYFYHPPTAFGLLALHVFLVGFDGPLARHLGVDSPKGSFTDSMADQTVIIATTITLMYDWTIGAIPDALYIITYTTVVFFAMV